MGVVREDHARIEDDVVLDFDGHVEDGGGENVNSFAELGCFVDICRRMDDAMEAHALSAQRLEKLNANIKIAIADGIHDAIEGARSLQRGRIGGSAEDLDAIDGFAARAAVVEVAHETRVSAVGKVGAQREAEVARTEDDNAFHGRTMMGAHARRWKRRSRPRGLARSVRAWRVARAAGRESYLSLRTAPACEMAPTLRVRARACSAYPGARDMPDVLHLYGNWKWTGPTELAVHLAESQQKAGYKVRIAFGRQRGGDDHFTKQTQRRSLNRVEGFELPKHFEPVSLVRDALKLATLLQSNPPDLIHCHLRSDHLIAAVARKISRRAIPIVRSTYEPDGPGTDVRERFSLRTATNALLVACEGARDIVAREKRFDPERTFVVEPAIDTVRFDRNRAVPDAREKLGLPRDAFVFGIVARVQARRRFDVFLEVARRLCERDPRARVVILGGGTHQKEVARDPAAAMGIGDRVLFPGVLRVDEYVAALRTFDVKAYMVPGTDGTCRAVKEAMCSGIPVVVADAGMLAQLVRHGETGLVFDGTADGLDRAVESLRTQPELRRRLGDSAHAAALARWTRDGMVRGVEAVYERVLGGSLASR